MSGDGSLQAGTVFTVLQSAVPVAGSCGPEGCRVADLATGAEVDVPAGGLAAATNVAAQGILEAEDLPAPVPAGMTFVGAARFTPDGQAVASPFATIYVPVLQAQRALRARSASFPLFYYDDNPNRTKTVCKEASCELKEINNGTALELNSLKLARDRNNVRLSWQPPALEDGTLSPDTYEIHRRPLKSTSAFVKIGTTTGLTFLETTAGTAMWEYEVTPHIP